MRWILVVVLLFGLWQVPVASASSSMESPLLGSWTVDVSRLPMAPAARPRSVVIHFSDAGQGKWTTHVDIVYANGAENHAVGTHALDGTPASISGSDEADVGALKNPQPDVLVMTLSKGGVPGSTRVYAVAADGQTMVETASYYGDHGVPILRTHYFTRVK